MNWFKNNWLALIVGAFLSNIGNAVFGVICKFNLWFAVIPFDWTGVALLITILYHIISFLRCRIAKIKKQKRDQEIKQYIESNPEIIKKVIGL